MIPPSQSTGLPVVERLRMIRGTQFTPIENALVAEAADTIEALVEALEEARLQLEYMDERSPGGTTPATLARVRAALTLARTGSSS